MGRPKITTNKISVIDLNTDIETFYKTQTEVAHKLKCASTSVSYAITKQIPLFGRYIIKYIQ